MEVISVSDFKELINKKIIKDKNTWNIVSYLKNDSNANVYVIKKNDKNKEYIIKLEETGSPSLFREFWFYYRIKNVLNNEINILPLEEFHLNISVNNIIQKNIILLKKKYCLSNYDNFDLSKLNSFCTKIIKALEFINSHGYVNGDIKPKNIVFDDLSNPYIIDFGIVCKYGKDNYKKRPYNRCGNYSFMSTDSHRGIISQRTDLFSFGFVLYYILENKNFIWDGIKSHNMIFKLKQKFLANNKQKYFKNPILIKYFKIVKSRIYNKTPLYNELYKLFSN